MSEDMQSIGINARALANLCTNRGRIFTKETAVDEDAILFSLAGQIIAQLCDRVQKADKDMESLINSFAPRTKKRPRATGSTANHQPTRQEGEESK